MRRLKLKSVILMPILTILVVVSWLVYVGMKTRMQFDGVPDSQNLLINSGFENWTPEEAVVGWEMKGAGSLKRVKGFNSRNGVRIERKGSEVVVFEAPEIKTESNQTYFFKTFYLTDTELNLVVQLVYQDGTSSYRLIRHLPDYDYPWSTMSGAVKVDERVKAIRWRIVMLDKGFLELDSAYAVVREAEEAVDKPVGDNLIQGSRVRLETEGELEAILDNYHLRVKNRRNGQAELFLATIGVGPNELYNFDFTYLASTQSTLNIEVKLDDGKYRYYEISENQLTDVWLAKSVLFEVPNQAQELSVFVQVEKEGDFAVRPEYALYKLRNSDKFSEPKISITFDDGWLSSYLNGAKILEQYGMRGTFYVVPNLIGRNEYMNEEQLGDLRERGHQIASHTFNHQDLSMMDKGEVGRALSRANQYLRQKLGLEEIDLASPYGKIDVVGLEQAKRMQSSHRGTRAGVNTKQTLMVYDLKTLFIDKEKSVAELKRKIELAKAFNAWLIIVYHQIEPNESFFAIERDEFEAQVKAILESGVKVETVRDVLNTI